jgi:ribonuclease-3
MEALIGATYLSNDIETARQLVMRLVGPLLKDAAALGAGTDWKTSMQELAASRQLGSIYYAVEGSGPDHARSFEAVLQIGGTAYGKGTGHSKKEAEQEAAADAWRTLNSKVALNGKADSPADPAHSA